MPWRGETSPDDALEQLSFTAHTATSASRVSMSIGSFAREHRKPCSPRARPQGRWSCIVEALLDGSAGSVLVTRADDEVRQAVRRAVADAEEDERARCVWVARGVPGVRGLVVIVLARDAPTAR